MKRTDPPLFSDSDADRREAEQLAEQERRDEEKKRRWMRRLDALDAAGLLMELLDELLT